MTFTKLFSSITESTIWCEDAPTRIVWITMLAMADRRGRVWAAIPGLASRAKVSIEETEMALKSFQSPDKYSRTQDYEGRRIEEIDGGWRLLNHAKYRSIRDEEERRSYKTAKQREYRAVDNVDNGGPPCTYVDGGGHNAEAEAYSEAEQPKDNGHSVTSRFDEFWSVYPKKVKKAESRKKWKLLKLDRIADQLIGDVQNRMENDAQWRKGFIPHPPTYINGERWNDDVEVEDETGKRSGQPERFDDIQYRNRKAAGLV